MDQITNRLCEQKTGWVLRNRRIKARMFRAFRTDFFAIPQLTRDARGFKKD
jgi:hypothetical protein